MWTWAWMSRFLGMPWRRPSVRAIVGRRTGERHTRHTVSRKGATVRWGPGPSFVHTEPAVAVLPWADAGATALPRTHRGGRGGAMNPAVWVERHGRRRP